MSNGFIENTAQSLRVEKYVRSSGEFFRQPRLDTQSFRPPLAEPSAPSVESKPNESSSRHEFVNLRLPWGCLHAGTKIIVDHKPTTVGQQIAIAIQLSAHIAIRIENEEAHLPRASICRNRCPPADLAAAKSGFAQPTRKETRQRPSKQSSTSGSTRSNKRSENLAVSSRTLAKNDVVGSRSFNQ